MMLQITIIKTIEQLKDKRIKWVQTVVPIVSKSLIVCAGVGEWRWGVDVVRVVYMYCVHLKNTTCR